MKRRLLSITLVILFVLGLFVYAGFIAYNADKFLSKADLSDSTVYLHNMNCEYYPDYEVYTVTDKVLIKNLIGCCAQAKKFRPFISYSDRLLTGPTYVPTVIFVTSNFKYTVSLPNVAEQLDLNYIYRNEPVIFISKTDISKKPVTAENTEEWYCTMSALQFSTLYGMIVDYWDDTKPSSAGTLIPS